MESDVSEERKVYVSDLMPGMYVSRLDRPWLESPFPFQGFVLENWQQVAEVQSTCRYVYVHAGEAPPTAGAQTRGPGGAVAHPAERGTAPSAIRRIQPVSRRERGNGFTRAVPWEARLARQLGRAPQHPPPVTTSLDQEVRAARPLILETRSLVRRQMEDARNGRSLDTRAARESVEYITESILRNPDALVWLSGLKRRDEYTYLHSLSVCILSISLGRHLGLPRETLLELGFGAFLHDIGKMHIPDSVLNKPGQLTAQEMEIMRKHPEFGVEIVDGSERVPVSSRNVVFSHHERLDGSGYTEGVAGGQIHPLTHIVSVCDTYDAIISQRPYKKASSPVNATAALYRGRGRFFEPELVDRFIRCIGIYPIGSLVELSTEEVGVVVATNEERLRPKVLVVLDEEHHRLDAPYEVDLSRTPQIRTGQRLDIKRSLETGAYGLQPGELLRHVEDA